jgi:hypothetical protein
MGHHPQKGLMGVRETGLVPRGPIVRGPPNLSSTRHDATQIQPEGLPHSQTHGLPNRDPEGSGL